MVQHERVSEAHNKKEEEIMISFKVNDKAFQVDVPPEVLGL